MGLNFGLVHHLLHLHGASIVIQPHFSKSGCLERLLIPVQPGFQCDVEVELRQTEGETVDAILALVHEFRRQARSRQIAS